LQGDAPQASDALPMGETYVPQRGIWCQAPRSSSSWAGRRWPLPSPSDVTEQLLSLVWGYYRDPGSNVVDVYVGTEGLIATARGMGYRLEP